MTVDGDSGVDRTPGWPVELRGVTESVVATLGPNDRWNLAALGLHAPADSETQYDDGEAAEPSHPVTARTYGRTRTWRNFSERGGGVVQFTNDPREFVDAALTVWEADDPVLPGADAWVKVRVEEVRVEKVGAVEVDAEDTTGTTVRTWELTPVESAVIAERVPTINRGFGAVIDATVAASRLDVPAYDETELLDRLATLAEMVERCGGPRELEAFSRIDDAAGWRDRVE